MQSRTYLYGRNSNDGRANSMWRVSIRFERQFSVDCLFFKLFFKLIFIFFNVKCYKLQLEMRILRSCQQRPHLTTPKLQMEWKQAQGEDTTNITRLNAIKQALKTHVQRLYELSPKKKVMIVTFESNIKVYTFVMKEKTPACICRDIQCYSDWNSAYEAGKRIDISESLGVSEALHSVNQTIDDMVPRSATALGTALSISVAMASQSKGAEIIVCTDGEPNAGCGSDAATYSCLGDLAKKHETTISLLGIEGSACALEWLSNAARLTSGTINVLHPLEIVREIRKLSQNPVVASEVVVGVWLDKRLKLEAGANVTQGSAGTQQTILEVGNILKDHDISINFGVSDTLKKQARKEKDAKIDPLLFQIQVDYSKEDGSRHKRIYTTARKITTSRKTAEEASSVATVALAQLQTISNMGLNHKFSEALERLHSAKQMLLRGAVTDEQQEEFGNFVQWSGDIEPELKYCKDQSGARLSDNATRVFYKFEKSNLSIYLSSLARSLAARQHVNKKLQEAYYAHKY
eukprot:TRINITY_DN5779_c0_g2_i2.p1 TRINITY_DN5779_c0_g2~~TRINITY_DN5779_c0_g2_i2.p1  ORF type:complete len:519 (-),score=115.02 TRINITY_DN5779_c0_g2_i2:113-1669(-)